MQDQPFSQSCENNKNPIFSILAEHLQNISQVVEIGSGSGQHACFFTEQLAHLTWQTTDQGEYFGPLQHVIAAQRSLRLPATLRLDVSEENWPVSDCECIFTANTLHIMPWTSVEKLFAGIARVLRRQGDFFIYGPFNYAGKFTSNSNARFDSQIKANNPYSGIRDFEQVIMLAQQAQLELVSDHSMPANNRLLHLRRK